MRPCAGHSICACACAAGSPCAIASSPLTWSSRSTTWIRHYARSKPRHWPANNVCRYLPGSSPTTPTRASCKAIWPRWKRCPKTSSDTERRCVNAMKNAPSISTRHCRQKPCLNEHVASCPCFRPWANCTNRCASALSSRSGKPTESCLSQAQANIQCRSICSTRSSFCSAN
ncbi:hypothetical protein D3C79_586660 [compost metagenome]